ncbi:MAG: GNAT family N-acetyltransferase [Desulforhopalus sp.]
MERRSVGLRGWWLVSLAVHPDHQRTGIARRMMDEAETLLRTEAARRSTCRCAAAIP